MIKQLKVIATEILPRVILIILIIDLKRTFSCRSQPAEEEPILYSCDIV